jgi:hypothetical protein
MPALLLVVSLFITAGQEAISATADDPASGRVAQAVASNPDRATCGRTRCGPPNPVVARVFRPLLSIKHKQDSGRDSEDRQDLATAGETDSGDEM